MDHAVVDGYPLLRSDRDWVDLEIKYRIGLAYIASDLDSLFLVSIENARKAVSCLARKTGLQATKQKEAISTVIFRDPAERCLRMKPGLSLAKRQ
ncbi:MAG: hypothetical protein M3Q07_01405 [Pseudobdellovibrionaceae bacterium]|nr:hypothetical protein [Pseudobdellovibrionaceae bacterium]